MKLFTTSIFVFLFLHFSASAQIKASIDDFAMLIGTWHGTGFGSDLEEVWSAPSGGQMMGMFKMSNNDGIILTEFMSIQEGESGFEMRVKHFSPEFQSWETKEEHIVFKFEEKTENEIRFEGLVIQKISEDELLYLLEVGNKDGSVRIEELRYKKVE